jgi:hypothetical protein
MMSRSAPSPRLPTHAFTPHQAVRHYFACARLDVDPVVEGLSELRFGEYLVERGIINRVQLLRALQLQDAMVGLRIGTAVATLGYCSPLRIELLHGQFAQLTTVVV